MPLEIRGALFNSECTISAGNTLRIGPVLCLSVCLCVSFCMNVYNRLDESSNFWLWKLPPAHALSGNFCHGKSIVLSTKLIDGRCIKDEWVH